MQQLCKKAILGRILLLVLYSGLVSICFGQKVILPQQPIHIPTNTSGRLAFCDDCRSATCTAGAITNQATAYSNAATNAQGYNPSEIRTVTDGDTVTFCATITTPAVLETNFMSFYGSYLSANAGCGASNIIDWRLTRNCVAVTPTSSVTVAPNIPSNTTRPIWPILPNTTYEMCYDVVVSGNCVEVSTPCFAPHWASAPCFLFVGTANQDCSRNDGTFDVSISFSNGGQGAGTYRITNNGAGTLGGDDPNTASSGVITLSNLPDGSGYDLEIVGNGTTSGCIFNITSPSYTCSFCPKITTATVEQDNCEGNTITLKTTVDTGVEGEDFYIEWLKNGAPINQVGSSTVGLDGEYGTADDPATALTYIHTLAFDEVPGACSYEDQVFTARLTCKTSEKLEQGNKNTASTTNSVIANYNAENSTCLGLDLTGLPNSAIAESFEYQYRATTGSPFGNSWICEAILTLNTPIGSASPVCHPFWSGNCPSQPAGATGSNNTTCFGGPGNGAGTLLNPTNAPAVVSYGGLNSTTAAKGNWQICVFDTYNDNRGSTEGVLNYVYFKVNYFLPPGEGVNFAESSIVDAVNISSPIVYPTAPVTGTTHPQGAGLVKALRVCNTPVLGTDFSEPNTSICENEVEIQCTEGIAHYSNDNGSTYTLTTPPGPKANNQTVYYQITTQGCPSNCGVTGSYVLQNCTNAPILATPTNISLPEDSLLTICTPFIDGDVGDTFTANICENPLNGTSSPASIVGNAICVTYSPSANYFGQDTMCLSICDQTGACDSVRFGITVTPVNDPPMALNNSRTINEEATVTVNVLNNDSDIDNTNLFTSIIGTSAQGVSPTINTNEKIIYTAPLNFVGVDTVVYAVCDDGTPVLCDTALLFLNVNNLNDRPILDPIGAVTLPEDSIITVCSDFTDPDMGDSFTASLCDGPNFGAASVSLIGNQLCITYTPPVNYHGMDTVCIAVCDQNNTCDSTLIPLVVTPVNDAPVFTSGISAMVVEDTTGTVYFSSAIDIDTGQILTFAFAGGVDDGDFSINPTTGEVAFFVQPDYEFPADDDNDNIYEIKIEVCDDGVPFMCDTLAITIIVTDIYEDCDEDGIIDSLDDDDDGDGEPDSTDPFPCDPSVFSTGVSVQVRMALAGNYDPENSLMWDSLRVAELLPTNQPYKQSAYAEIGFSGTESIFASAFSQMGNDAIVDWVVLELRSASDSTQVVARRAALLQRDGDVVHVDGFHSITFPNIADADYFVVARHRNHMGVMTANAQNLTASPTLVDFTLPATATYRRTDAVGLSAPTALMDDGKMALWAGNMYADDGLQRVIFQGNNADTDVAYFDVLLDVQNEDVSPIWVVRGYLRSDGNLDGKTIFQGGNSDTDIPFFTVLPYPDNELFSPIFVVFEQLP